MSAEARTPASAGKPAVSYTPPALIDLGTLHELTLGCTKRMGDGDGFTFHGAVIVCTSP